MQIIIPNFSLLAQNQVADFHTEIERLDHEEIQNDPYIKHPIQIEQYLMEGNYNKVLMLESFFFYFSEVEYSTFLSFFWHNRISHQSHMATLSKFCYRPSEVKSGHV